MSIIKTIKESDREYVLPNEEFKMKLGLTASPDFYKGSLDTCLILDTSGSMIENGIEEMKASACRYADILLGCECGENKRIAVVSFDSCARIELPLTNDICRIKRAVNSLEAKNYTNHADAFKKAYEALKNSESSHKVAVLFTDGDSTIKGDIEKERQKLLSLGTEIYTIALGTPMSLRVNVVKNWASIIKEEHFFLIKDKCQIEKAFKAIAEGVTSSCTKEIYILEKLSPGFIITGIEKPSKGSAEKLTSSSLRWYIPFLGKEEREEAELIFNIKYCGCKRGRININDSIALKTLDEEEVSFPNPSVVIGEKPKPHCPDYCEEWEDSVEIEADSCVETVVVDGREELLASLGRIVYVNVTLKDICPDKRVALGVILTETDSCGREETRGMKTLLIPAHHDEECRDIKVGCIKFAVPESLSHNERGICGKRKFNVRTIVNYIDAEFICCGE